MEDLKDLIAKAIAGEGSPESGGSEEVYTKLRSTPLLDICVSMKPQCTDPATSAPALRVLLRATRGRAGKQSVSRDEFALLFRFFSAAATTEGATQVTALEAVSEMLTDPDFAPLALNNDTVGLISNMLAAPLPVQSLPASSRRRVFTVLRAVLTEPLLSELRASISDVARDFPSQFLSAVDGERDPELVVEALEMHAMVAQTLPAESLDEVLEDMFDSISSYFPIVFYQPQGCSVTKDDLRTSLAKAMTCPVYVDLSVMFLCDKITSPGLAAKVDATELLVRLLSGASGCTAAQLAPHSSNIARYLRNELVKASAFQDAGNPALKGLMSGYLNLLRFTVRCVSACGQAQVSTCVEPILSGAVTALSSSNAVCAAYASMLHAISTHPQERGCIAVATFLIPTLAMTLGMEHAASNSDGVSQLDTTAASLDAEQQRKKAASVHNGLLLLGGLFSAITTHFRACDNNNNEEDEAAGGADSTHGGDTPSSLAAHLQENEHVRTVAVLELWSMTLDTLATTEVSSTFQAAMDTIVPWVRLSERLPSWAPNGATDDVCDTLLRRVLHSAPSSPSSVDCISASATSPASQIAAFATRGLRNLTESSAVAAKNVADRLLAMQPNGDESLSLVVLLCGQLSMSTNANVREACLAMLLGMYDAHSAPPFALSKDAREKEQLGSMLDIATQIVERGDVPQDVLLGITEAGKRGGDGPLTVGWFRLLCASVRALPLSWRENALVVPSSPQSSGTACGTLAFFHACAALTSSQEYDSSLSGDSLEYWVGLLIRTTMCDSRHQVGADDSNIHTNSGSDAVTEATMQTAAQQALVEVSRAFPEQCARFAADVVQSQGKRDRASDGRVVPEESAVWRVFSAVTRGLLLANRVDDAKSQSQALLDAAVDGKRAVVASFASIGLIPNADTAAAYSTHCIHLLASAPGKQDMAVRYQCMSAIACAQSPVVVLALQSLLVGVVTAALTGVAPGGDEETAAWLPIVVAMLRCRAAPESPNDAAESTHGGGGEYNEDDGQMPPSPQFEKPASLIQLVAELLRVSNFTTAVLAAMTAPTSSMATMVNALEVMQTVSECALQHLLSGKESSTGGKAAERHCGVTADIKKAVLLATKSLLGHKKRRVRQSARHCRHQWYKLKGLEL